MAREMSKAEKRSSINKITSSAPSAMPSGVGDSDAIGTGGGGAAERSNSVDVNKNQWRNSFDGGKRRNSVDSTNRRKSIAGVSGGGGISDTDGEGGTGAGGGGRVSLGRRRKGRGRRPGSESESEGGSGSNSWVYMSKAWALKWATSAYPGPVSNHHVVCRHGRVKPNVGVKR